MTSIIAAPRDAAPAAAESPLRGLQRRIEARIAAVAASSDELERELIDASAHRANVAQELHQVETQRARLLQEAERADVFRLVRACHDALALSGDRGELEERILMLRAQLTHLANERALLERLRASLGEDASGGDVDVRSARMSQASRHIFQLVEDAHEDMASAILDGAMSRLSDAAMDAELAGHVLSWDTASAAESLARCRVATVEAATTLQRRIGRLQPIDADQSLEQAVRELLAEPTLRQVAHLRVLGASRRADTSVELTAFRVIEAALDNAIRHGNAHSIDILISHHAERLVVVVKDDGEGFDVVATEARLGRMRGMGLIQMHERATLAGGRLDVRSQTGAGTEVRLTLPLR